LLREISKLFREKVRNLSVKLTRKLRLKSSEFKLLQN